MIVNMRHSVFPVKKKRSPETRLEGDHVCVDAAKEPGQKLGEVASGALFFFSKHVDQHSLTIFGLKKKTLTPRDYLVRRI